jgi:two-component system C4-dicarboxylate transport response regulator DctD
LLSLPATPGRLRDKLEAAEAEEIRSALRENSGGISATCQTLGISRRALYERMKKYGLSKESFRP